MPRIQHPVEVYGMDTILEDGVKVEDLEVKDLLFMILNELKDINTHLQSMTEEELENDNN